jgi:hypothetical protein
LAKSTSYGIITGNKIRNDILREGIEIPDSILKFEDKILKCAAM